LYERGSPEECSYLRLIDFLWPSALGLRVIKKKYEWGSLLVWDIFFFL